VGGEEPYRKRKRRGKMVIPERRVNKEEERKSETTN